MVWGNACAPVRRSGFSFPFLNEVVRDVKDVKDEILTFVYRKSFRSGVNNFL